MTHARIKTSKNYTEEDRKNCKILEKEIAEKLNETNILKENEIALKNEIKKQNEMIESLNLNFEKELDLVKEDNQIKINEK